MANSLPTIIGISKPFAEDDHLSGGFPVNQASPGDGKASMSGGFPEETAIPIIGGTHASIRNGVPPNRLDMNELGFIATQPLWLLQQGGYYTFNTSVSNKIGGYPQGAVLYHYSPNDHMMHMYMSLIPNNTHDFRTESDAMQYWRDVTPVTPRGRSVGDIFWDLSKTAPTGALPLSEGLVITNANVDYPDFWNWVRNSDLPKCTEAEWVAESAKHENGSCGYFVVDDVNKTIHLPKIVGFTEAGTLLNAGSWTRDGLPNLGGMFSGVGQKYYNKGQYAPFVDGGFAVWNRVNTPEKGVKVDNAEASDDVIVFNAASATTYDSTVGALDSQGYPNHQTDYLSPTQSPFGKSHKVRPEATSMNLYIQAVSTSGSFGLLAVAGDGIAINSNTISNTTYADVMAIKAEIPNEASTANQLADKAFVNSSIENVAAFYITKNASGDAFATKAELDGATVYYSGGEVREPTRNDYCLVLKDEEHPDPVSGEDPTTRYLYNNGWEFQYVVNNSGLTAAQLAAVNSGITGSSVTVYNGYNARINGNSSSINSLQTQVANLGDSKQNALTSTNFVAGTGMSITFANGTITVTNTNTSAEWGKIIGEDITVQTDLMNWGTTSFAPRSVYAPTYISRGGNAKPAGSIDLGTNNSISLFYGWVAGNNNLLQGKNALVIGDSNTIGAYSAGVGIGLMSETGLVVGTYNIKDENALFVIGNGTSGTSRSNAFKVLDDGAVVNGKGEFLGKDISAFEILATTASIPANSSSYNGIPLSVEISGTAYNTAVAIPAGNTHTFALWTHDSEVYVDWGDGTVTKHTPDVDEEVNPAHAYRAEGIYRVRVYANSQVKLSHGGTNNQLWRVLEDDLPMAAASLQGLAGGSPDSDGSLKLLKVNRETSWRITGHESWNFTFGRCKNLRSVTGFGRIETAFNVKNCFESCYNLIYTDFRMPALVTSASEGYRYMYSNCRSLSVDIAKLFPEVGFAGEKIDLSYLFYCNTGYTVPLTGTVPAWALWENTTKAYTYANKSTWAANLPTAIRAQIPVELGGTGNITIPSKTTKEYVDAAVAEINSNITTLDGRLDDAEDGISALNGSVTSLTTSVTAINGKIPAQASATNQLADKSFVNSSIATATANYISDDGQPFTSVADLPTTGVTINDYAFVTGTDTAGNTYFDRYKYTATGWAKEYRLNNSSFTAAQWAAISSGITSEKVAEIDEKADAFEVEGVLYYGNNVLNFDGYTEGEGILVDQWQGGGTIRISDTYLAKINNALTQTVADARYASKDKYGDDSMNVGVGNSITGNYNKVIGNTNSINATGAVVIGNNNTATATGVTIGDHNTVSGTNSICLGQVCYSYNTGAACLGKGVTSIGRQGSLAIGLYNNDSLKGMFSIGNGSHAGAKRTIFHIYDDGSLLSLGGGTFTGDVIANGGTASMADMLARIIALESKIAELENR